MLHLLANYLTTILLQNYKIADTSKKEIYEYGFKLLISTVFSILSILTVSTILEKFTLGVIFLVVYIPCRMVSGGYHAKTYAKCYWISMATYLCVAYISQLSHNQWSLFSLIVISSLVIIKWAPISNPKHPLSDQAFLWNRRLARIIVAVVDSWVICKIFTYNISEEICVVVTSIAAVAVMMIISKIQERREKYECVDSSRNCY